MSEPVTLINSFEVPADQAERFIAAWEVSRDFLQSQPGYIETALTSEYLKKPGVREDLERLVPAGRLGVPSDVVGPALFLSSRHANFITGHVLYVDGGRTLV